MLGRLKRLVVASPGLRAPLMLLRKLWRDRRHIRGIASDLLETHRATGFLRRAPVTGVGRTLNLYAVDDDSIYGLKLMAFISQALRLRGWQIQVVLRNRSMMLGRAYFRAFGIRRFVYLEDHRLADEERALCRRKAQEFLDGPLGLQGIKAWTFEGCWIGPQIISTLSRIRFEGSVDFAHPEVRRRLKEMLVPALESWRSVTKSLSTACGVSTDVGSSRISNCGLVSSARTISTRCRSPTLSVCTGRCGSTSRP